MKLCVAFSGISQWLSLRFYCRSVWLTGQSALLQTASKVHDAAGRARLMTLLGGEEFYISGLKKKYVTFKVMYFSFFGAFTISRLDSVDI